jgi:lysyl-tRNA synthetase class 2
VTSPRQQAGGWCPRPPRTAAGVARLVQAAGLLDIVSGLLPPGHRRFVAMAEVIPVTGVITARTAIVVIGALLVYLGAGLRRGKHRAWQIAVTLSAASVALHVVKGLDVAAAVLSAALLAMLIVTRTRFRAQADPRNRRRAVVALAGFAGTGFLLGFIEIALRVNRLEGAPGLAQWAEQAALGLVGVDGPVRFVHPMGAEAVSLTTGSFGLLAAGAALVLLLRPGARIPARTDSDDEELRALLARHGGADSLGYFALRHDKSLLWSPSRKAVIAYRVINGVSLAAGDPIGDLEAWPGAITSWLDDCNRHGWTPAVLGCGNAGGKAYRRGGLDVVEMGDEAVVDVTAFTLQGRQMRGVRQAVARVDRAGYTLRIARQADLAPDELAAAVTAADGFRDGAVERGFSMALSRIGDAADAECLIVLCRDADGRVRGVLQFVPWGADGLSLDLMRGDRTADNGLMEFMLAGVLQAAPGIGVRQVSLNFAVLRSVFARAEELGAGPVLRLWHRLLRMTSRFWQIESLYRANAKYQPAWRPRYVCFPTARDLPRIAIAALKAEAFLPSVRGMIGSRRRTEPVPAVAEEVHRGRVLTGA